MLCSIAIIVSFIVTIVFGVSFFSGRQGAEPIINGTSNVETDYTYESNYETGINASTDNSVAEMTEEPDILLVGGTGLQGDVVIGNVVTFGAYEQDNDFSNGLELIEWEVIDIQDGRALLLSRYALDNRPFNTDADTSDWEGSEIRAWLNGEFYNAAFSTEEQGLIRSVRNETQYFLLGGYNVNETIDEIFLFSNDDLKKYFSYVADDYTSTVSGDEHYDYGVAIACSATDYAVAQGLENAENGYCYWWLRSEGHMLGIDATKLVSPEGYVNEKGTAQDLEEGIRPALWIELPDTLDEEQQVYGNLQETEYISDGIYQVSAIGTGNCELEKWYEVALKYRENTEYGKMLVTEEYWCVHARDEWICIWEFNEEDIVCVYDFYPYSTEMEKEEQIELLESVEITEEVVTRIIGYTSQETGEGTNRDVYCVTVYQMENLDEVLEENLKFYEDNWEIIYQ